MSRDGRDYVSLYLHPWDSPRNEVNKFGRTPELVRKCLKECRRRILHGPNAAELDLLHEQEKGGGAPGWIPSLF